MSKVPEAFELENSAQSIKSDGTMGVRRIERAVAVQVLRSSLTSSSAAWERVSRLGRSIWEGDRNG